MPDRSRSASAPRERGPRVQHKNSPSAKQTTTSTQQQERQLYHTSKPSKESITVNNNVELPLLKSLRPASSNGRPASNGRPRSASASATSTPRPVKSGCASQRSAHSDDCIYSNRSDTGFSNSLGTLGTEKCVCFICTCGKHHCPPAYRTNTTPLDASTHYSDTYKAHEVGCYPERVKVSSTYVGTRAPPGHFDTTNKAHYEAPEVKHHTQNFSEKMERSTRANHKPAARETFDHTSIQRQDYPWHNPSPTMPIRPSVASPISAGPFMGMTTSKDTYQGWKPGPEAYERASHAGRNATHTPFANDPTDFSTSYSGQYVEHVVPEKAAPKQKATYSYGSPRTGQFQTSTKLSYTGEQNPVCPAHKLQPRPPSASTGHVKYRLDLAGTWS